MKSHRIFSGAAIVAVAMIAYSTPATAAIKVATITGTLYGGGGPPFDGQGSNEEPDFYDFGDWSATITYDTAGSSFVQYPVIAPDLAQSRIDNVTILKSTFTFLGQTVSSGAAGGFLQMDYCNCFGADGYIETVFFVASITGVNGYKLLVGGGSDQFPLPLSFENNFSATPFVASDLDDNGEGFFRYGGGTDFIITGRTMSVTDAPVVPGAGAVPEPATWAMLIAGFGLVGAAARRRREMAVST
jgi:hypothetical protein